MQQITNLIVPIVTNLDKKVPLMNNERRYTDEQILEYMRGHIRMVEISMSTEGSKIIALVVEDLEKLYAERRSNQK